MATRARLLDATVECLVRHGFAGASTAAVAAEAGVSQGALFKHFPGKASLLGAACEALLARLVSGFRDEVAPLLPAANTLDERLSAGVRALWRVFRRPEMHALFEVYVVARTDPQLEAELAPRLDAHRQNILAEARGLFPEVASHAEFESVVDAVVLAMQGAVLGLFGEVARDDERQIAFFERLARRELEHTLTQEPR